MFMLEMAICAILGMLLCSVVVWIGLAWGWKFVRGGVGAVDMGDELDD